MTIPSVIRLIVTVFFLSILPSQVYALTPDQVFNKVKDSIVVVRTLDAEGEVKIQGSGVLLPSRKIATNCHVVEGGTSYQVGQSNQLVTATLYAEDGNKDICLLDAKRITGKPAELGKAAGLKVGDPVYAVGAPKGLELSLSDGLVVQLRGGPPPFIQTTAVISPGSSGGGLFDGEGRLVGLTTLYIEGGQSLNFAMPVEWIGKIKPGRKPTAEGLTEWWKRAIVLEQLKDWQGILDWCRKWAKSEPGEPEAWIGLALAYGNLKRYDEAIETYRQVIRIDPKNAFAWDNLGNACGELKRYDEASMAYRQALRIDPEYTNAWFKLGVVYHDLKRYDDEIETCRQVIRINPEDAKAWNNLGIAYFLSGDKTAALEAIRELRRLDPEKADELFNLIGPQ
jgi:regulator of sirC expression with transglutaminase-like and TPR domain